MAQRRSLVRSSGRCSSCDMQVTAQPRAARRAREAQEQEALIRWARLSAGRYRGLALLFAIPNGAYLQGDARRRTAQWARLKAQGAREGVSDLFLPVARGGFHGLWIEVKSPRPHPSRVSDAQREWMEEMAEQGYRAVVCYGAEEAMREIRGYYE